jgi:hypothetical protein
VLLQLLSTLAGTVQHCCCSHSHIHYCAMLLCCCCCCCCATAQGAKTLRDLCINLTKALGAVSVKALEKKTVLEFAKQHHDFLCRFKLLLSDPASSQPGQVTHHCCNRHYRNCHCFNCCCSNCRAVITCLCTTHAVVTAYVMVVIVVVVHDWLQPHLQQWQ